MKKIFQPSRHQAPSTKHQAHLLITAGPTQEPLDPVRFISNYSTGTMGYTLAREAEQQGYKVVLISGPTALHPPKGVKFISVTTAQEMYKQVKRYFPTSDCLVMTAAVCDFHLKKIAQQKIKKKRQFFLKLEQTPDILYEMGKIKGKKNLVGFALESQDVIKNALRKLKKKRLDLIVAQKLTLKNTPFGEKKISPILIHKDGRCQKIPRCSKSQIARRILQEISSLLL